MFDQAATERDIRAFLDENFPLAGGDDLAADDSLIQRGVIDSTGVLELIEFLEETYAIEISDEEVLPENLDTIARMTGFVGSKLRAAEGDVTAGGVGA